MEKIEDLNKNLTYLSNNILDLNSLYRKDKKNITKGFSYITASITEIQNDTNDRINEISSYFNKYNEEIVNLRLSLNSSNNIIKITNNNVAYALSIIMTRLDNIETSLNEIKNSKEYHIKKVSLWNKIAQKLLKFLNGIWYHLTYFNRLIEEKKRIKEEKIKEEQERIKLEEERIRKEKEEKIKEQKRIEEEIKKKEELEKKRKEDIENKRKKIKEILSNI